MAKKWYQKKENYAVLAALVPILAAIVSGGFLLASGCFSKTPPTPSNNVTGNNAPVILNASNQTDNHSQNIYNFNLSGIGLFTGVTLIISIISFFTVRAYFQRKIENFQSPKENDFQKEATSNDLRAQGLMDCFSKLVAVVTAFDNYVCYMPDTETWASNRQNYVKKKRAFEENLQINLFIPLPLKKQIMEFLDEITRQVSHYITGYETVKERNGAMAYASFVVVCDFAKGDCQRRLKKIEKEFHHLLYPSGNAQNSDTINTIKTLHKKIRAARNAYDQYRQMMEPVSRKDNFKTLEVQFHDAWNFFSENRLYLGDSTIECVNNLLTHINAAKGQFKMFLKKSEEGGDEDDHSEIYTQYLKTDDAIPILYQEMEKNFKQVLGVA